MQKDYRDVLEVMKFDIIEETVGSWLRAIIRRLEVEQAASKCELIEGPCLHSRKRPLSHVGVEASEL
jgi:hypothetical protein